MRMQAETWRRLSNFGTVTVYAVVILSLLPLHEGWRDEAQAWLIARDLGIWGIIRQMSYEGHTALWHLLLAPLAKGGLPYESAGVLNAVLAISAVAVLVYLSPFSLWQKLAFAVSFPMVIVYGLSWRPYAMDIFMMFLAAAAYRTRLTAPIRYGLIVAALANGTVQTLGVALILLGIFVVECITQNELRGRRLLGAGIMGAGVGAAVLQLLPAPDAGLALPGLFPCLYWTALRKLAAGGFSVVSSSMDGDSAIDFLCIAGFAVVLWDLRKHRHAFWLLLLAAGGWGYAFTFKSPSKAVWHMQMLAVMFVMALWIARGEETSARSDHRANRWLNYLGFRTASLAEVLVFGSLLLSVTYTVKCAEAEVFLSFSGARETAQYIRAQHVNAPLAVYESHITASLLPYLPGRQFYQLETRKFGTFVTWTRSFETYKFRTEQELAAAVADAFPKERPWLLTSIELQNAKHIGYRLVFRSTARLWGWSNEQFWLYEPVRTGVTPEGSLRP